jgi:para-aminobenzoate synthetase component 1
VFTGRGNQVKVEQTRGSTNSFGADPFDVLRDLLRDLRTKSGAVAVGYLGYGLRHHIERLPSESAPDLGLPDYMLAFYDGVTEIDPAPLYAEPAPRRAFNGELRSSFTRSEYEAAVQRALGYIRAGDVYQVNLSQRFETPVEEDPFEIYLRLRRASPAPFAGFLRYPEFSVLSSSPEQFLGYDYADRHIETRPIKGTRPRGNDPETDIALGRELLASAKDNAENVMIVDLLRNDLGRVSEIGSVRVTGLAELESFANVHHLVSTVEARLDDKRDVVDLLRATFPGGSITGAPKIRAMEIIDELEPVERGVYTGTIGYFGADGDMNLNIAIRTIVVKDGTATFSVGGGIVADSDPVLEYEETLHKGAGMAAALAPNE